MKKTSFLILSLGAILALSGCGRAGGEVSLEAVFPKEANFVAVVDATDSSQRAHIKEIFSKFPEKEDQDNLREAYLDAVGDEPSYEKIFKPLIEGDFEFGVSFDLTKIESQEFDKDAENLNFYIAGRFEEEDKLKDFVGALMDQKENSDFVYEKRDGMDFWTSEAEDAYLFKKGEILVFTVTEANRDAAILRLDSGDGFNQKDEVYSRVEQIAESNLGYVYIAREALASSLLQLTDEVGDLDDTYAVWLADENGVRAVTELGTTAEDSWLTNWIGDTDYRPSLIDKVNGDNLIFYSESPSLNYVAKSMVNSFVDGYNTSVLSLEASGDDNIPRYIEDDYSYDVFLENLAKKIKKDPEDLEDVFDSPMAMAVTAGEFYPTVSLYIQLEEDELDTAKELTVVMDGYMEEVIDLYEDLMKDDPLLAGQELLKKDVEVVDGGGLHKLYLDWTELPQELIQNFSFIPGMAPTDIDVEIYYGVTGDNVFVIALYPQFDQAYGNQVVSENEEVMTALEQVNAEDSYVLSYFSPRPMIALVDKYVALAKTFGALTDEDLKDYQFYIRDGLGTLKYMVSAGAYIDDALAQNMYGYFEEVGQ